MTTDRISERAAAIARPRSRQDQCSACKQDAARFAPVGPVEIRMQDPEFIGPEGVEEVFCCWDCMADFFAIQAGREPPAQTEGDLR